MEWVEGESFAETAQSFFPLRIAGIRVVLGLPSRECWTDNLGPNIDVATENLPPQDLCLSGVVGPMFFVEVWPIQVHREKQMALEIFSGRVVGLADDEAKSFQIFFLKPPNFAGEDVPGMREDERVPVSEFALGPLPPTQSGAKGEAVADLEIEIARFAGQGKLVGKSLQVVASDNINVLAEES